MSILRLLTAVSITASLAKHLGKAVVELPAPEAVARRSAGRSLRRKPTRAAGAGK